MTIRISKTGTLPFDAISPNGLGVIESPFRGCERAQEYLDAATQVLTRSKVLPLASHRIFTSAFAETDENRLMCMDLFISRMRDLKPIIYFFIDFGLTPGMRYALERYQGLNMVSVSLEEFSGNGTAAPPIGGERGTL